MVLGVQILSSNLPNRSAILVELLDSNIAVAQALSRALRFGTNFNSNLQSNPSEDIISSIAHFNEIAEELIRQLPRPPISYMSRIVSEWFEKSSEREKEEFITTDFNNLIVFMSLIGNNIIEYFHLWSYHWKPQIENGIDISPHHPENLALAVIQAVWRIKQDA